MSLTCRAAIIREIAVAKPYATTRPLSVETITLEPPQAGELLVKVAGAGLCHSDLSVINGNRRRPLPMVMGHEGSGEVVETGAGVRDVKAGDHVVFQFTASCGRCRACLEGRQSICSTAREATAKGELMGGGSRIRDADGQPIRHQSGVSCFAEYTVVDRGSVVVIDKSVPLADAAVFGCAVMTGAGAVLNTANVRTGEHVAIIGLGGVGLNGVMAAALSGAKTVIALDIDERKLATARALGATHALNAASPTCVDEVISLTGGGVDYAIELAGAIAAMSTAYAITRRGGKVVTAGLSPDGAAFSFPHADLVSQEKSILGSYMGSCVAVRDIPRFIALQSQGRMPVERLIDGHIGLDQINEGFDRLASGAAIRQIVVPHG